MGSSLSTGRKFSPTKNVSDKNPTALIKHAKFSCGDPPNQTEAEEYIEETVCQESELVENEMKLVDIGKEGDKVLLVRQKGKITALGTKCTHYGAPLNKAYLGDGRIRCQWHGACFNINTGDIEDYPGLDSLPCYQVTVEQGNIKVKANKYLLKENKRVKSFVQCDKSDPRVFVIVGGGPAGVVCVETLRQEGFKGRIVFVCKEAVLPYDRIKLSKSLNTQVASILLRPKEFYEERGIEVLLSAAATSLNTTAKKVKLANDTSVTYDKIFIATGASSAFLDAPGNTLRNIYTLRNYQDAEDIYKALNKSTRLVIVGTSFIGMEAAAYCVGKVKSIVIVGRQEPFKSSFGPLIGSRIMKLYEEKNIQVKTKTSVKRFVGKSNMLASIILQDNTELPADVCLIGIGSIYNTSFLYDSGIKLEDDGTIGVNEYLQTQFPDVFAGGDVASANILGEKKSGGHWGLAHYHGRIAALNMLDKKKPLKAIPFFWTMLLGKSIRFAGSCKNYDDIVIDGNIGELNFIAFYCYKDDVVAVTSINRDPMTAKYAELLYGGDTLKKKDIMTWLKN